MKKSPSIYAIGDIHGCHEELLSLLNKLPLDSSSTLVFLGDYIDRGPSSKDVIQTIIDLKKNYSVVSLMGNHEEMFLEYMEDPFSLKAANFIYNGGAATLASYSDDYGQIDLPEDHLSFFQGLQLYHQTEEYFFVHAGVPNVPLSDINAQKHRPTLLWIRDKFLKSDFPWDRIIVHGHTPVTDVEITERRINLDTGCVFNNKLSAMELPSRNTFSVPKLEKTPYIYLKDYSKFERRRAKRFKGNVPVLIYKDKAAMEFITVDYNDLGLCLISTQNSHLCSFEKGEMVLGEIRPDSDPQNHFKFTAYVVRVSHDQQGYQYGLEFQNPPLDTINRILR